MTPPDHPRHRDDPQGWHVRHVAETGSTNADLLAEAATARDRTVLRADHQTAGRGRLDRRWDAPAGANLLVSILFRGPIEPAELVRRVGLAVVLAARDACGVDAALKWPNDVLVDGRKAAGVLAQQAPNGAVVVGAGVNLGWAPDGAARLGDVDPDGFLLTVLDAFDALPDDVSELYRASLATLGRRVRVERPTDAIVGTAIDVDAHGRLVVLDECAISHHIEAGDVIHLRPAP